MRTRDNMRKDRVEVTAETWTDPEVMDAVMATRLTETETQTPETNFYWSRTQTGRTPPPHYRLGHLNRRTPHAHKRPHSAQVTVTADDPRTDMACGIASRDRAARKLAEALASTSNSRLVRAPRAKACVGRSNYEKEHAQG